jgi:hypothetical protein
MTTPFSVDDLTTPLTRVQVQASIYQALAALGVRTTNWKPGAVVRTMIVGVSIVLASLSKLQADIARSGFLETSAGKWLTLVARYVYGIERGAATFATGPITLTNTAGGVYSYDADDLTFRNPDTGKTYTNTEPVALGAVGSETAVVTVAIRAIEAGSNSSAAAGAITSFVTPLLGVTCSNPAALVSFDEETDPQLRLHCTEQLGALSPFGPWDAYGAAIRNATYADGTRLGVTRIRITKDGYGNVTTYLATDNGGATGDADDPTTQLGVANDAVQRNAEPLSVTAHVVAATSVTIAVTYELWMYNTSGRTPIQVQAMIETALEAFFAAQPIGGNVLVSGSPGLVYVDAIRAAIANVLPQIFHVVVSAPLGDVTLAVNEVPTLGLVTPVSVHQVAPPEGLAAA